MSQASRGSTAYEGHGVAAELCRLPADSLPAILMTKPAFPDGHFYSPVVNVDEVGNDQGRIWAPGRKLSGIDLNPGGHEHLLQVVFPSLIGDFDYPTTGPTDDTLDHFYDCNGLFERHDARVAFCLLRMIQPRRIVEVGSGYSTLLLSDTNNRFLDRRATITCIEPFPRHFLRRMTEEGHIDLIENRVQGVDVSIFTALQAGDILFIDSSHVSKTGSDVNRLILDILPMLAPGVFVHFHDIFLPRDYPPSWVIEQGRSWNEQYLLQAYLAFNPRLSIVYGSAIADVLHVDSLSAWLGDQPPPGGSLWLRCND
jgi:predicted O-methyltransferase YrrM